jgi:HEAT repeat protein
MGIFNRLFWPPNVDELKAKIDVDGLIKALEYEKDRQVQCDAAKALGKIGNERAVEPLINALKNKEGNVRRESAEALGKIGDTRAVEPLVKALGYGSYGPESIVVESLVKMGKPAVEPLIQAMKDKNRYVRKGAAYVFFETGDARAVEPLVKALGDEYDDVCKVVGDALVKIGAPAVEPLIQASQDENKDVRRKAVEALVKIEDERAVEPLIQALQDDDFVVRREAAEALVKIGDARAVDSLIQALKDEDFVVRQEAAEALVKIEDGRAIEPLIQALKDKDSAVRWRVAESLVKMGAPAVEPLIQALKDESGIIRMEANSVLLKIREPAVEPLIQALKDENKDVRAGAAEALGKIGDTRAVEPLIQALKDENKDVRAEAAKVLGKIGDTRAVEPLIHTLKDESSDVREQAVASLEKLGKKHLPKEVVELADMVLNYRKSSERTKVGMLYHTEDSLEALRSLCLIKNPAISNILYKISQIKDKTYVWSCYVGTRIDLEGEGTLSFEKHRKIASKELARRKFTTYDPSNYFISEHEKKVLKEKAEHEKKVLKEKASKALREMAIQVKIHRSIQALNDENYNVRKGAVDTLGKIGDARAVEPLIQALKDGVRESPEMDSKLTALEKINRWREFLRGISIALAKIGEPAVKPLIQTLKEEDEMARRKVADALGEIGDTRAVEPLTQSLTDKYWTDPGRERVKIALEKIKSKKS